MNKVISVKLNDPINVSNGEGEYVDVSTVKLSCGGQENLDNIDIVSCAASLAMMRVAEKSERGEKDQNVDLDSNSEDAKAELKPEFVLLILRSNLDGEAFSNMRKAFTAMLANGILSADGVKSVKDGFVRKLSVSDIYLLLGTYVSNFTMG